MQAPVLIPFLSLAAGIVLSRGLLLAPRVCAAAFALSLLLTFLARCRAARVLPLAVASAALWLGASVETHNRNLPPPVMDVEPNETVVSEGCVVESPAWSGGRAQFLLELAPHARARMNLYLRQGETPPLLEYGQRVEVDARFRAPRNFENPGSFDYAGYLARREVFWLGSITGASGVRVLPGFCGSRPQAWISGVRTRALRAVDERFGSDPRISGVLRAALLGDGSRLDPIWSDEFRRTATYHVLVISGLHITALSTAMLFLLRLFPGHPLFRLAAVSILVWFYALLCGAGAPVLRAAGGTVFFLLGGLFHRRAALVNLLALTGFVFLCADPSQLFEASFQLSFLAVGILGVAAGPLAARTLRPYRAVFARLTHNAVDFQWPRQAASLGIELQLAARLLDLRHGIPRARVLRTVSVLGRGVTFLGEMVLVSSVMQAALMAPMIFFFHRAPVSGFLANLIVTPLMTASVPAGGLALLTGFAPLVRAAEFLITFAHTLARWLSSRDPAPRIPDAPLWLLLAAAAAFCCTSWALHRRGRLWSVPAALTVALLAIMTVHPFAPRIESGVLELTAVDVGQGESLLLAAPGGATMLIDGGGLPAIDGMASRLEIGEDVVSPYLWSRGLQRLDIVAVTHADQDHMGGIEAILRNFAPRQLWVTAMPELESFQRLLRTAAELGVAVVTPRAGDRLEWSGAMLDVLSPEETRQGGKAENNDSLVLRARFGRHAFLLTGDAERQVENRLTLEPGQLRADVLKVGHHGSRTSSTPWMVEAVRPVFAVISAGQDNRFRHPHPETLDRLAAQGARVLRTDRDGLVTVRSDGRRLTVETRRRPVHEPPLFSRQLAY